MKKITSRLQEQLKPDQLKAKLSALVHDWMNSLLPQPQKDALTISAHNTLMERFGLADYLTYGVADDDFNGIWIDDNPKGANSILIGYQVSPLIMAGQKASQKLEKLIKRLPTGAIINSVVHASDDVEGYLENWCLSRKDAQNPIFNLITTRRAKHMLDWCHGKKNPMSYRSGYQPRIIHHYLFIKIPANFSSYSREAVDGYIDHIEKLDSHVVSQLGTANMPVLRLSGSKLALIIKQLANLHLSAKDIREVGINTDQSLASQIITPSTKLVLNKDGVMHFSDTDSHEEKYVAVLSANKYHEKPHYLADMQHCIGSVLEVDDYIPGEFYSYTIIEKLDVDKRIKDMAGKLAVTEWHTSVKSQMFQNIFRRHHRVKQHLYDFIDRAKSGEGAVKVFTGMVLSARTEAGLTDSIAAATGAWAAAGIELKKETVIALPMWLATLPGHYTDSMDGVNQGLNRGVTTHPINAASLLHVQGDWTGSHPQEGGMLLMTRRGAFADFNLFNTFKSNFNCLVAATSGAGKSFFIADWVADFLARNGIVRIVDAGRSYFNLAEVANGKNIVCDRQSKLCFNPFSNITTKARLDESIRMLSRLIAQMCFPDGYADDESGDKKPWEESFIGYAIEQIWNDKHHKMSVLDIYHYCEKRQKEDPRIKDMVMLLYKWSLGHHAHWFVGENNVELENPFVVLELDELQKDRDLQNVVLNLILAGITEEMYYSYEQDKKYNNGIITPKCIIIDEAWSLLARPNSARFVEEAARRIRKYRGAIIIITQSFMDMAANSAAKAFIENCNWIISLMQDIGTVQNAQKAGLISVKDYSFDLLESLHKTDDYSEVYILNKSVKGEGVYRLVVDLASYWTYTTDGAERSRLNNLITKGMSVVEAINQLAKAS